MISRLLSHQHAALFPCWCCSVGINSIRHVCSTQIGCISYGVANDWSTLSSNYRSPPTSDLTTTIFYGFSSAMLGISGFETSANFIEEQEAGVYPKTLRNMIISATMLNPTMSFLSFVVLPIKEITNIENSGSLLSLMATQAGQSFGGQWLFWIVSIDAVMVLSATVLTAFIGVSGLLTTMARDNLLPATFLHTNERFGTTHWIIFFFWFLCSALIVITRAAVDVLANTYTVTFLFVMGLFALGNMMLKCRRASLRTELHAYWITVVLGLILVLIALVATVIKQPETVPLFFLFFTVIFGLVLLQLFRRKLVRFWLRHIESLPAEEQAELVDRKTMLLSWLDYFEASPLLIFASTTNVHWYCCCFCCCV